MSEEETISPCQMCGGPVVVKGSLSGSRYYVPVADTELEKMMDKFGMDWFIRERLQRAERIIVELRDELKKEFNGK